MATSIKQKIRTSRQPNQINFTFGYAFEDTVAPTEVNIDLN
jgi:hypothetical protein